MPEDMETMRILANARSTQAALKSMGYGMTPEQQAEEAAFAKMMEERNEESIAEVAAEKARKRARAVSNAGSAQKPVKQNRLRNVMATQPSSIPAAVQPVAMNADDIASMESGIGPDAMNVITKARGMVSDAEHRYVDHVKEELAAETTAADNMSSGKTVMELIDDMIKQGPTAKETVPAAEPELPKEIPSKPENRPADEHPSVAMVSQPVSEVAFKPSASRNSDFTAFSEIRGWPSRALAYGGKVYGQSITMGDMFIVDAIDEYNSAEFLSTIIGRHVRGVEPDDVLSADELYLMHWLRASSYPKSGMPGPAYTCKTCGCRVTGDGDDAYTVNFGDLVFTPSADPEHVIGLHRANGYVTTHTYDGRECHIYLRRRRHNAEISAARVAWEHDHGAKLPSYYSLPITMAAVVEIEGIEGILAKMDYIFDYPTSVRAEFIDAITEASLSTKVSVRATCPACGGVAEWPYPFHAKKYLSGL